MKGDERTGREVDAIRMTCYPGTCTATDASSRTRTTPVDREPNGVPSATASLKSESAIAGSATSFPAN